MDADADAGAGSPPPASPGTLLKLARERAGLGVDDLANQLKLAKVTLEALEQDNFAALSEPVYVRGYYRKIAKVLLVPEKELIEAYARCKPAAAAPVLQRIPQLAGGVDAGVSRRGSGQGLGLVIAVVVVTLGLLFLFSEQNKPVRLTESEPVPEPVAASAPATAAPEAAAMTPAPEPAMAEASGAAPTVTVTATAGSPAAAVAGAVNQLVLEFSESSFVRVEDSRNRTLAIGLVRGGERQMLSGQAPYTVFLGNARNVKVFHMGQPVDFSSSINAQNDTARFTVP